MLEKSAPYGTSAAVINGGGIRASIGAGDITMGQVKTMLPFGNTLAVVEITGQQLLEALENGVSMADDMENLGGRFPRWPV
jgi:5'-nucleotidase